MVCLTYKQSQEDNTLFLKQLLGGKLSVLIIYIDDITFTSDDLTERQLLKEIYQHHLK